MSVKKIDLGLKEAYEELFMDDAGRAENRKPKVDELPLAELKEFPGHPFRVREDEEMERLKESVRQSGVLIPAIVRPSEDGGYEIVSGHRRWAACKALGMETMPVIVRNLTDDEAIIAMVDANLQREHILPSEKAFAYKMKMEAMKHQGKATLSQVATKSDTAAEIGKQAGESRDQVFRYIRLTYLSSDLLQMVDEGKIALSPAVELSYLSWENQNLLYDAILECDCTPSHAQAIWMRSLEQQGILNQQSILDQLQQPKPNQREQLRFPRDELEQYFPRNYTPDDMKRDIIRGLELLRRQRERDRDGR